MLTSSSPRLLVTRSVFGPAMVTCAMTGWPVRGRMCAAEACNSNGSAAEEERTDRKSTRLNSSHLGISYAVFCLKKKKKIHKTCASSGALGTRDIDVEDR